MSGCFYIRKQNFKVYCFQKVIISTSGTWLFSAVLASPPLFGLGHYDYLEGQSFCFCDWTTSIAYTFFMVVVCFGGPCSAMVVCYILILRHVRASKRRVADANGSSKDSKTTPGPNKVPDKNSSVISSIFSKRTRLQVVTVIGKKEETPKESVMEIARRKKLAKRKSEDLKLALSFVVVTATFVLSWLPFCITMFWSVFAPTPVPRILDMTTLLLGCSNSCGNPIIYGVMNASFREGFKKLFCLRKIKIQVSTEDQTNCN